MTRGRSAYGRRELVSVVRPQMRGLGAGLTPTNTFLKLAPDTSVNPLVHVLDRHSPLFAAIRATIDVSTGSFKTARAIVLETMHRPGTQYFEESAGYWKIIQYPQSMYPCTTENMRKVGFRPDIWNAAQVNLARLYSATLHGQFVDELPPWGSVERDDIARLFADWYIAVMSWVSLAAYSTNMQPAFLCVDPPLNSEAGSLTPTRTAGTGLGLPQPLETLRNEIKGLGAVGQAYANTRIDKGMWGPSWMGFYDRAEATGWLTGDFTPARDPAAIAARNGNGGVTEVWPKDAHGFYPPNDPAGKWSSLRNNIDQPWFQVYYSVLYYGWGDLLGEWQAKDTTGTNSVASHYLLGPQSLLRTGRAWCDWVTSQTCMDVILDTVTWYSHDYMNYWKAKGLGGVPPAQALAMQREVNAQRLAVKEQKVEQTVGAITQTAVALTVALASVPVAGQIAAGCALLVFGVTKLILWRRRRKQVAVPLMQPVMMRQLSDSVCNYFPPGQTLEGSLVLLLDQVKRQTTELNTSSCVPSLGEGDPLGSTMDCGTAPALTLLPAPDAPVAAPGVDASTGLLPQTTTTAINTSNSNTVGDQPVVAPLQTLANVAVQVERNGPGASGTATPDGAIPWDKVGMASAAALVVVLLLRRR